MSAVLKPAPLDTRPLREDDLEHVARIERAAYAYPWTLGNFRDCLTSGYSCWAAELEGRVVGYGILMMVLDEGHLLNCCIAPQWQRRGLGRALMHHLLAVAADHRMRALFLEVRLSNRAAIALYEELGFEAFAQRRGYYPADQGREDALVMRRTL